MNKFLCIALSVLVLFGSALSVSAQEPEFVDSPYCIVDDSSTAISTYALEPWSYTSMRYYSYQDTPNGDYYETDVYTIGERITTYYPDFVYINVVNTEGPLFTNPGDLSLLIFAQGNSLKITTYFLSGSSKTYIYDPKLINDGQGGQLSVIIPNPNADIKSIYIELDRHIAGQYITPTSVLSLDGYSYEIKESSVFDVIVDFFSSFFTDLKNTIVDFFTDDDLSSAINSSSTLENGVMNDIGRLTQISLYEDFLDITGLINGFFFISSFLTLMFSNLRISIILQITVTLVTVTTVLGFARHHKK